MLQTILKKVAPFFPWLFWLALIGISILLLIEMQPSERGWPYFDKVVHATMFFSLSVLGYIAYNRHLLLVYLGLACYGIAIECLQSAYTLTRVGNVEDWFADIFGILLSFILMHLLKK